MALRWLTNTILGILVIYLANHAHAQTLYSKAFYGDSTGAYINASCSLTNNCDVAFDGHDAIPILVNPWESVSITIQCVQIVLMPDGPLAARDYAFAGNSITPDVMIWGTNIAGGAINAKQCFPAGMGMPFPAGPYTNGPGQNNFALPHLDVHIMGTDQVSFQAYLIVWYTKNPSQ